MSEAEVQKITSFLSKVPFFAEVSQQSLAKLSATVELRTFDINETIFEKGDEGKAMFTILEGAVKVHEREHHFGNLEAGDSFGEYALIDNQARSASVTATEETKVLEITRKQFLELMKLDAGFAQGVLSVMIKRHRELDSIQEHLSRSKKQLEVANAKMSGLIDGAMDAILMFDRNFRIILTNPSANALLENDDAMQRNVLFFFDEGSASLLESMIQNEKDEGLNAINKYLPQPVKVIGSKGTETLNEGTLSKCGKGDEIFYTLILRNLEERLRAEDKIGLLTQQTEYLEEELKELTSNYGIIAQDVAMRTVLEQIEQVAQTTATALITGETGTGKELVARAIHKASPRNDKPLIRVNCGAIPSNLIESELFGHEKGAFTGATSSRKGRFLLADKGTIFLDEIGELPLELQPKLLRVIQEGEFDPVGSSETIRVDVRIIAATHRDLLSFSKKGRFREDLYYRLNVFPIRVPALRDRGEDLFLIAKEILQQFSIKLNKSIVALSEKDKEILASYHWPGNVRELQNTIERAVILTAKGRVNWEALIPNSQSTSESTILQPQRILNAVQLQEFEKENILRALKKTGWKISGKDGAAALLKLPPTTLASKIKSLNISRPV